MSVPTPDRRQSKTEFNNAYYRVHDDALNLFAINFGAKGDTLKANTEYIIEAKLKVGETVFDLGKYIRIANSIFPTCKAEKEERRIYQDKALGMCFDLLVKYELIMHRLNIRDDKYTNEIKHIMHEINCLRKWRTSDNKRFKDLG